MAEKIPIAYHTPADEGVTDYLVQEVITAIDLDFPPDGDDTQLQANVGGVVTGVDIYWDATNSRLGIGTSTPSTPLHVAGDITADNIGTLASQDYDDVDISGGIIGNLVTPLLRAHGGTGQTTPQSAINALTTVSLGSTWDEYKVSAGEGAWVTKSPTTSKHWIQQSDSDILTPRASIKFVDLDGSGVIDAEDDAIEEETLVTLAVNATPAATTIPATGAGTTLNSDWFPSAAVGVTGVVALSPYAAGSTDWADSGNPSSSIAITEKSVSDWYTAQGSVSENLLTVLIFS